MRVIEISEKEWQKLGESEETYFQNGCLFDDETDNLIAFCWYVSVPAPAYKHYKVVEEAEE